MCVQYIGGCSVHRGVFSTSGEYHEYIRDIMSTLGVFSTLTDTMSTSGDVQYIGGCSVHRGDIMMYVGDMMSTSGDVQYMGVFNIN